MEVLDDMYESSVMTVVYVLTPILPRPYHIPLTSLIISLFKTHYSQIIVL